MGNENSLLRSLNRKRLDGRRGHLQKMFFPAVKKPDFTKEKLFVGWERKMEWVEYEEHKGEWEEMGAWKPFFIDITKSITSLTLGPRGSGKTWPGGRVAPADGR